MSRGVSGRGPAGLPAVDAAAQTGTLDLYTVDFTDGSVDAATMGAGSVGRWRAFKVGGLVSMELQFKLGTGSSLGTWPICVRSPDLPAALRPAVPDQALDATGQTDWSGFGTVQDPSRTGNPTGVQCFFGWADFSDIPSADAGPAYPIGVWQVNYLLAASTGTAIKGVDATTGEGLLNMGATTPFQEALHDGTRIQATITYEAA